MGLKAKFLGCNHVYFRIVDKEGFRGVYFGIINNKIINKQKIKIDNSNKKK